MSESCFFQFLAIVIVSFFGMMSITALACAWEAKWKIRLREKEIELEIEKLKKEIELELLKKGAGTDA